MLIAIVALLQPMHSLGDTVTTGAGCTCIPSCSTNYKYQEFSIAARSVWIYRVQCLIVSFLVLSSLFLYFLLLGFGHILINYIVLWIGYKFPPINESSDALFTAETVSLGVSFIT